MVATVFLVKLQKQLIRRQGFLRERGQYYHQRKDEAPTVRPPPETSPLAVKVLSLSPRLHSSLEFV